MTNNEKVGAVLICLVLNVESTQTRQCDGMHGSETNSRC